MAETALDLSAKPSANPEYTDAREDSPAFHTSPKHSSGRSSTSSNSDATDQNSGPENSSSMKSLPIATPSPSEDDETGRNRDEIPSASSFVRENTDSSVASTFKSFHHDPLSMYASSMMPALGMNPALAGLGSPGLMDTSTFPSFPMTPLTSHLLQRKRRPEPRCMEMSEADLKKTKPVPEEKKDDAYWERRRKNNEAAKRSRDTRRQKEDEIAMRAAYLEQENLKLRAQVALLKNETSKLHYLLYNRVWQQTYIWHIWCVVFRNVDYL